MSAHNAHVLHWKRDVLCNAHVMQHPCWNDNNNCTVRAIKNAFDISYPHAYEALKQAGRPHGCGLPWESYRACIKVLAKKRGMKLESLDYRTSRREYGKTVVSAQRRVGRHETVFFNVRSHTMSFRQGYTNDWADGRRHHIWQVWRLTS